MRKVLGGPGCGKTTRLLQIIDAELAAGTPPSQIALVAFTRKAAHEAKQRAIAKFGFSEEDIPFFRTLHSFAFHQLGLTTNEVMSAQDYAEIGTLLGYDFGGPDVEIGLFTGATKGDEVAYIEQLSRLSMRPLQTVCVEQGKQRFWDVKLYADTLGDYKRERHRLDFTDMLEMYANGGKCPPFAVAIVDEAQDLSPLQWRVANKILSNAQRTYIAGDDDQAIYTWAGADVEYFINVPGEVEVLPKSHRLPRAVFDKVHDVLRGIRNRVPKEWGPAREGGAVRRYADPEQVNVESGSWLLLARNRYMLTELCGMLRRAGFPYSIHGRSSTDNDVTHAVMVWESLRAGGEHSLEDCRKVAARLVPGAIKKRGLPGAPADRPLRLADLEQYGLSTRADWMEAIRMPSEEREYLRACRRRGEKLTGAPRITVSTIHQAKGGEADNVMLLTDMAFSCHRDYIRQPDNEHRVFYVGASRARDSLHIIYPSSNKFFTL